MTLKELQEKCHKNAVDHGFWDDELNNNVYVKIALFHSEISEFMEDIRKGLDPNDIYFEGDKPCGPRIELADLAIRLLDCCGQWGIDLEKAITDKMKYNETRPYKHGGKKI